MKQKIFFIGRAIGIMAFAAMCFSQNIFAQNRFSFEFRPGVDFATRKVANINLETGFGFEGTFAYRFMPHLGVYAGWSLNRFAGPESDFEETGYAYGLQFIHPLGTSKLNLLARAAVVSNHIEVENSDGEIIADSGHGLGWQVEGGVAIPINERWQFLPSIRYKSLSRDIEIGSVRSAFDLRYLSLGIGASWMF